MSRYPGAEATARLGWWRSHRFLLLRRLCQFGVLTLFLLGPLAGIWILKGNLSSSLLLLETVPLTDPLTLLAVVGGGPVAHPHPVARAGLVLAGYWLVGGGCSAPGSVRSTWSPMPPPGSGAARAQGQWSVQPRYPLLAAGHGAGGTFHRRRAGVGAGQSGVAHPAGACCSAWGAGWGLLAALFLFDLLWWSRAGAATSVRWGLLCPGQPGRVHQDCSLGARAVQQLHGLLCGLPGASHPARPRSRCQAWSRALIAAQECTNCGRCIDVCAEQVLKSL